MKLLKSVMVGALLLCGGFVLASNANANEEKKEHKKMEKKCMPDGKECKDGADCKAENCKKETPK